MKKKFLLLFIISLILTTIGVMVDEDQVQTDRMMKITEFSAITAMLFSLLSPVYFSVYFIFKNLKKRRITE